MRRGSLPRKFWITVSSLTCISLLWTTAAYAAWSGSATTKSSGVMRMASFGWTFTPIRVGNLTGAESGTGGAGYTSTPSGTARWTVFDLRNNSTMAANPNVTIKSTSTSSNRTGTLFACQAAWTSQITCPSGAITLAESWSSNSPLSLPWGSIAPEATLHMALSFDSGSGNVGITAVVDNSTFRPGRDRTAG